MAVGSDCPTGKVQYASRVEAEKAVRAGKARGWTSFNSFRCAICRCWHTGNRYRSEVSKSRRRRIRSRTKHRKRGH